MNCKKAKLLSVLLLSTFTAVSLYASGLKTAAPVVKSKPIMTVEYEYSRSGRITARKINGQVQNYKYDKKGQLLGVYDGKGNAIEEYVYDPAGNILKKTIQGKTTTYKYDKANQLVLSECNGKITKYEYDAAGRLVKEGDKVYSYIGLDKIESVTENGRRLSSFTYHIDGQLAARVSIESSEEFQWDGLALIQRNSTNYVNEPAVTGGNPILADDKVLFNDMLGTTLGVKDGDKVMQNNLTAFGESLSTSPMEDSFFTGKPHVGEMGYVFLFRAYRADQGKWQTADPLGYPDGWNNFAYVNNGVIFAIDWLGGEVIATAQFDVASAFIQGFTPPGSAQNHYVSSTNRMATYDVHISVSKNNKGITVSGPTATITNNASVAIVYYVDSNNNGVWDQTESSMNISGITGSVSVGSMDVTYSSAKNPDGSTTYTANVKVYVYEKVTGGKFAYSNPVRSFTTTIHHTVAE